MAEQVTISFAGDKAIKEELEKWAAENGGSSVSSILRKLIEAERARRAQSTQPKAKKQETIAA